MCGRYALPVPSPTLEQLFDVEPMPPYPDTGVELESYQRPWSGSYAVAPSVRVPILYETLSDAGDERRHMSRAAWNFRPHWAKPDLRPSTNARLETVAEKPFFRAAFASRRCLIPMTGYYEWVPEVGEDGREYRQPYYLSEADPASSDAGPVLLAAGLYSLPVTADGSREATCVIITTTGHDEAGRVHDRMPVLLDSPELAAEWVSPGELPNPQGMLDLLALSAEQSASSLTVRRVSTTVNNSKTAPTQDPGLLAPV